MTTLIAIELRRMLARRLMRALVLLAVAGMTVAGILVFVKTEAPGTGAQSDASARRAAAVQDCIEGQTFSVDEGAPPPQAGPVARERFCDDVIGVPQDRSFNFSDLKGVFTGTSVPLAIAVWILAASFIGADWRAGTVATQLAWETRRLRLVVAKAIAAVITGFGLTIALQAFLFAVLLPSTLAHGTSAGFDASATVGVVLRGAVLAAVWAAIGFSVGSLGRNTTAAVAAGFVYLAIFEMGLIGSFLPWIRRWLIMGNAIVFMSGKADPEIAGRSPAGAAVLLVAYGIGLIALASNVFRARDVT